MSSYELINVPADGLHLTRQHHRRNTRAERINTAASQLLNLDTPCGCSVTSIKLRCTPPAACRRPR
jgi:hypothetical protein